MKLWWLSFADANKPEGQQFNGAVMVEAHDFIGAVKVAHALGVNPGGECKGAEFPDTLAARVPRFKREKLMDAEEAQAFSDELDHLYDAIVRDD